ncbi:MAG: glycosyltransferase family 4 protein [Pyrinomonadaceae bacterium]
MRIAIVNWSSRKVGGAEAYLDIVIPELVDAGHQVAFFHEVDEPLTRDSITLPERTPTWCVSKMGAESALAELGRWSPEVIYAHGLLDPELETATLKVAPAAFFAHAYYGTCISGSKTWSNPTVRPCSRVFGPMCLLHYFPHRCGGLNPLTMLSEYRRQGLRLDLLRRYRYVLTASEHMRAEFTKHGLSARLLPLFVSTSTSLPERFAASSQWRILFLGRMDRLKGGVSLLESLPIVSQTLDRSLHVTFAGDGPDRQRWESRALELKSTSARLSFEFPGWVSGNVLNSLLVNSDLLVIPSLWPEPFGLSGPQAGLRGVPAAAFDVGGISDWLKDGVNGHLARADPPTSKGMAEAVIKCLRDPEEHIRLKRGAVEMARRFDVQSHVSALTQFLGSLVLPAA